MSKYAVVAGVKYVGEREICLRTAAGKREYERRKQVMVTRQLDRCAICINHMITSEFDHQDGRGFSGSRRDDRIWTDDGQPMNAALCHKCNTKKGSQRYTWFKGAYIPCAQLQMAS